MSTFWIQFAIQTLLQLLQAWKTSPDKAPTSLEANNATDDFITAGERLLNSLPAR